MTVGVDRHQQFSYFFGLRVVRFRNVELTTLNITLLGRQPKYCEIPFSIELALFSIFSIDFWYNFHFGLPTFVCF